MTTFKTGAHPIKTWLLRNSKDVRKVSLNTDRIKLKDHLKWWEKNKHEVHSIIVGNRYAGYLRDNIDIKNVKLNDVDINYMPLKKLIKSMTITHSISIALKKKFRNDGLATRILAGVISVLGIKKKNSGLKINYILYADIKNDNTPSIKLFTGLGFKEFSKHDGYTKYKLEI